MKILKLTIHNIASIADAVIDFTLSPLNDAGLFLISGKTGAGKSTILDCICLALYDETPRLNSTLIKDSIKDFNSASDLPSDDTRQMLSKYAAEGFAQLEFIGNNNVHYRATWSVNRAHLKVTGKLQGKKRVLERLDKNISFTKQKEIAQEIAAAVNLDFQQFCRTVMLAQGEFTRFLNSNDNDKSAILSKITGTEIYSVLGAKVYEKYKQQLQLLEKSRETIAGMEILTDDQLEEKHNFLKDNASLIKRLNAELELHTNILSTSDSIEKTIRELDSLDVADRKSLTAYRAYSREIEMLQQTLNDLDIEIENLKNEGKRFENVSDVLNRSESIIATIDRIVSIRKTVDENTLLVEKEEKLINGKLIPECDRAKEMADGLKKIIAAKEKELNDLTNEIEKINLPKLRKNKEQLMQERVNLENMKLSAAAYEKELADLEGHKKTLAESVENYKKLAAEIERQQIPALEAKTRLDTMQEIYDKLFASSEEILSKIRGSLSIGDICPVCRNKISEALPSDESIAVLTAERKRDLDDARKKVDDINKHITTLRSELSAEEKMIVNLNKRIEQNTTLSNTEKRLRENCKIAGVDSDKIDIDNLLTIYTDGIETLRKRETSLNAGISDGETLEKNLNIKNREIREVQQKVDKATSQYNELLLKATTCKNRISALKQQNVNTETECGSQIAKLTDDLKESVYFPMFTNDETEGLKSLRDTLKSDAREMKALVEKVAGKTSLRDTLKINLENHRITLNSIEEILPAIADENDSSDESSKLTINSEKLASFGTILIGDIRATRELRNSLTAKLKTDTEALRKYQEQLPDEERSEKQSSDRCRELKLTIEEKNREMGAVQSEIEREMSNRDKRQKLQAEYKLQETQLEKWRKLQELFGDAEGKKFRKIAQSYILSELIHSANHYLAGFTDRYRLTIEPGTFVIIVEDAWDGYARRPASTISGGESFMVSLSLALALSDLSADFSVDTLFIDEGFGSLSQEYLQSAINTLRTLHSKSGRRVGIISHVEELRERIPVQINVSSSPNTSSSSIIIN